MTHIKGHHYRAEKQSLMLVNRALIPLCLHTVRHCDVLVPPAELVRKLICEADEFHVSTG